MRSCWIPTGSRSIAILVSRGGHKTPCGGHHQRQCWTTLVRRPDKDAACALRWQSTSTLLDSLDQSQIQAVTQPLQSVTRVVAGPGSGKTEVITKRIMHLMEEDPHSGILALTFTNTAAKEMKERVENYKKQSGFDGNLAIHTFHSLCRRLLIDNKWRLSALPIVRQVLGDEAAGFSPIPFNVNEQEEKTDTMDLLKKRGYEITDHGTRVANGPTVEDIRNEMAILKAERCLGRTVESQRSTKVRRYAEDIFFSYVYRRWSANKIDFQDYLVLGRDLLENFSDVRQAVQSKWPHILVDEYQDSSIVQVDLVRLLTNSSLMVVGDPDQSIFGFSGVPSDSMERFPDILSGRQIDTVVLSTNFRSPANMVRAADKFIAAQLPTSTPRAPMTPYKADGPPIFVKQCDDLPSQCLFVVKSIKGMLSAGKIPTTESVAVLYRTNVHADIMEFLSITHDIPYTRKGSNAGFFRKKDVADAVSILKLVVDDTDETSAGRAKKALKFKNMELLKKYTRDTANRASELPMSSVLGFVAKTLEIFSDRVSKRKSEVEKEEQYSDLSLLTALAAHYDYNGKPALDPSLDKPSLSNLASFLDDIAKVETAAAERRKAKSKKTQSDKKKKKKQKETATESSGAAVNLLTMHASKGASFDHVFVIGYKEASILLPEEQSPEVEEETRVFFVAMTREKKQLIIVFASSAATKKLLEIFWPDAKEVKDDEL